MDYKTLLFSFEGRINRKPYWMFILAVIGVAIALALVTSPMGEMMQGIAHIALTLLVIWPGLAMQAKRWHDRDKSAWWILINFIPFIGPLWVLIECGFLRGTPGQNRFGPDPLAGGS
jgi:uncharacterized membrane protein YhaH (DUF805 family)